MKLSKILGEEKWIRTIVVTWFSETSKFQFTLKIKCTKLV